jgi:hypothetical protein
MAGRSTMPSITSQPVVACVPITSSSGSPLGPIILDS